MSFYDLQRFRREQDRSERAARDLKLAEERIENLKWQQRCVDYDREQEHHRAQAQRERDKENEWEQHCNNQREKKQLQAELEDLKLRRKFGIEEDESK